MDEFLFCFQMQLLFTILHWGSPNFANVGEHLIWGNEGHNLWNRVNVGLIVISFPPSLHQISAYDTSGSRQPLAP